MFGVVGFNALGASSGWPNLYENSVCIVLGDLCRMEHKFSLYSLQHDHLRVELSTHVMVRLCSYMLCSGFQTFSVLLDATTPNSFIYILGIARNN